MYDILNWVFWIFLALYGLALAAFIDGYVLGGDELAVIFLVGLTVPWVIVYNLVDEISWSLGVDYTVTTRMYVGAAMPMINVALLYWLRCRARSRSKAG